MEMYISIIYIYIYVYVCVCVCVCVWEYVLIDTFYLRLYGIGHMEKEHSARENPLLPHRLLFPISSKGSFICTIPQTGYINTRSWLPTNLQSFRCVQDSFHLLRSMWAKLTKNVLKMTDLAHYNS